MQISKKTLIIISIAVALITIAITIYLVFFAPHNSYPKEPITQDSIGTSNESVEIKKSTAQSGNYPVYGVSNNVQLEKVKEMITTVGLNLSLKSSKEGSYYSWSDDNNSFLYDLTQNTLVFKIKEGIQIDEAEITGYTFSNILEKYFSLNWEYSVFTKEKRTGGETVYYAKRKIASKYLLELRENNNATDYLAYKDGKIIYGKILLAEFSDSNILVPLISEAQLKSYINLKDYPKELSPQYSSIQDSVLSQVNYLSEDFEDIADTLSNCNGNATEVIYLYKSLEQKYLTPVYKLDLQCDIKYKENIYQVPTTGYVNAVDPNYVTIPE